MIEPDIGGRVPIPVDVGAGKSPRWGVRGSKNQPLCDGSHKKLT